MDYSEVPLHKRTRHQFDLFYKRYHEERQKAKSGGSSGAACGVGGGAELSGSVSGGREEKGSEVNLEKKGENAGDVKGFGSGNSEKKEGLISESRKGFKRAKNRAEIGVGSDRDGKKSKEGVLVEKGIRELQKGLKSTNNGIRIEIGAKLKNVGGNSKRGLKSKVSMDAGSKGTKRESSDNEGVTGNAKKRPKRTKSRGEIGGSSNGDRKKLPEEFKSRDTGEKAVIKKSETGSQRTTSRVEKDVDSKKLRGNSKRELKGTNAIQIDTSDDENGDDGSDVIYNSSNRGWPKAKGKDSDYMDAKEAVSSDQKIGGGEGVMSDQGKESGVAGHTQLDSGSSKESQTDSEDSIDVGDGVNSDQKMESGIVGQTPLDSESQSDSEERESSSDNEGLPGNVEKGSKRSKGRGEIGGNLKKTSKVGLKSKDTGKEAVIKKPEKGLRRTNSRGGMEVDTKKVRGNSKRELKGTNVNRIDSKNDENGDDGIDDEVKNEGVIYSRLNRGWPKAKGKDSDYMDTKEVVSSDQKIGGGDGIKSDQGKESGVVGQTRLNFGALKESQADFENSIGVGDGIKSDQKKESGVVNQTPSDSESQTDSEELESSSEEDNDDEDDKDFVGDDSDGCNSCSSSEDRNDEYENEDEDEEKEQEKDEDDEVVLLEEDLEDDECRIVEIESVVGKGKEKSIEVELKRKYKPRQVNDSEGLSSIGVAEERKDELESSIMEGGSIDEVEKDRSIEGGLKRRKFSGLDILVDSSKLKSEETKSVANRLRSRSVPKSKRRKLNLGTISRPFTVDDLDSSSGNDEDTDENDVKDTKSASKSGQKGRGKLVKRLVRNHIRGPTHCDLVIEDELDPFSGSDDVGDETDAKVLPRTSAEVEGISSKATERRHIDAIGNKALDHSKGNRDDSDENVGKDVLNIGRKGNGKFEKPAGGRHIHTRKGFDPLKILTDSIWEKGSSLLEDTVPPSPVEEVPAETTLVYKFRFEDEVPKPPEKSYWDQQSDILFEEMAMALRSSEIGSFCSAIEDDSFPTRTEASPIILCQRGIHEYILDDQIGLICRICSFVEVEIKHILPTFCKNPRGRSGNQYYGKDGCSFFTELQSQDPVSENPDGRVCTKGTVWDLVPGIKDLYPHQCEGFEFMWKNVAGGIYIDKLEKPLSGAGGGCIISHAPGTGKTLMTIVFLQSFLNLYPESKPIIVAPKSMLLTWEEEFRKWKVDIPFHNLNKPELSGKENTLAVNFLEKCGYRRWNTNAIRFLKLYSWIKDRSIVGISYNLFGRLAGEGVKEGLDGKIRRVLLEIPTLLVLDEGHTARNDQSLMWNALSKVETQRCIILSGTPFQNNCGELYNILCLVSPNLVGRMSSKDHGDLGKKDGRESKSARRRWASLTSSDVNIRDIKAIVDPLVHIYKGTILDKLLHGCKKALVVLKPTDLQKSLTESIQTRNFLERDRMVSLISVHPSLLLQCYSPEDEGFSAYWGECEQLKLDHRGGVKTRFLIELIRLCGALKEKVLVFSQYLDPLAFLMKQLKACFNWTEGREVLYIDGQHDIKQRQLTISSLNDPTSDVQVLLASIKACSEGINLVGASRVVLLDIGWNPSVERQAISRAYRIGQKKTVYIYHLITFGTMEGRKCLRQAEKDLLSQKVFSSADMESCIPKVLSEVSEDKILNEMVQHEKLRDIFEITNQPRARDLLETPDLVDR